MLLAGAWSAVRSLSRASKAAGSSPGTTIAPEARPCLKELRAEVALPVDERGPVDWPGMAGATPQATCSRMALAWAMNSGPNSASVSGETSR